MALVNHKEKGEGWMLHCTKNSLSTYRPNIVSTIRAYERGVIHTVESTAKSKLGRGTRFSAATHLANRHCTKTFRMHTYTPPPYRRMRFTVGTGTLAVQTSPAIAMASQSKLMFRLLGELLYGRELCLQGHLPPWCSVFSAGLCGVLAVNLQISPPAFRAICEKLHYENW
jgi:hypothetical protein